MQSKAKTVAAYLAEMPEDRRAAVQAVRRVILTNLDADYAEVMQYGMIAYVVPHRVYPPGYHCQPELPVTFVALASQKGHLSLYLMGLYYKGPDGRESEHGRWFREAWKATGKKLDAGSSCVRFKRAEDLPLEVVGEAIRRVPARAYIAAYEAALAAPRKARPAKEAARSVKPRAGGRGTRSAASKSEKLRASPRAVAKKTRAASGRSRPG